MTEREQIARYIEYVAKEFSKVKDTIDLEALASIANDVRGGVHVQLEKRQA